MKAVFGPDYSMLRYGTAEGALSAIVLVQLSEEARASPLKQMMIQNDKIGSLKGTRFPRFVEQN